jgi:gluconolactonase
MHFFGQRSWIIIAPLSDRFCAPFLMALCVILGNGPLASNAQETLGSLESLNERFDRLVSPDASVRVLARGFTWTEGPVWVGGADGYLLFSDIPRNTVYRFQPGQQAGQGISVFMKPSGYTGVTYYGLEPGSNGLILDPEGRLILCEHGDRRVSLLTDGGGKLTLADRYQGKRLNSPNDAVLAKNGDIFFTDPPYGLPQGFGDPLRELEFCGVYRLTAAGELTLLTTDIERPNGIGLSPDGKTLYVAQSNPQKANWTRFQIQADGSLGAGFVFHDATGRVGKEPGLPDGMVVDSNGNIWATGPGGVFVFDATGQLLGRIITGQRTSNCTLAPDGQLYITADSYLCRIQTRAEPISH